MKRRGSKPPVKPKDEPGHMFVDPDPGYDAAASREVRDFVGARPAGIQGAQEAIQRQASERFIAAVIGPNDDKRYANSRAWLRWVSAGWGLDLDLGDVDLLLDTDAPDELRSPAVCRLAGRLARNWPPQDPAARGALRTISRATGLPQADLKARAVEAGLLLAAEDRQREQGVRWGRRWLTKTDGKSKPKKRLVRPVFDLGAPHFMRWLMQSTFQHAEDWLVEEGTALRVGKMPTEPLQGGTDDRGASDSWVRNRDGTKRPARSAPSPEPDGRAESVGPPGEPDSHKQELIELLRVVATPAQRQLIEAWFDHPQPDGEVVKIVAERLGISTQNVRVQLKRLGKKAVEHGRARAK